MARSFVMYTYKPIRYMPSNEIGDQLCSAFAYDLCSQLKRCAIHGDGDLGKKCWSECTAHNVKIEVR